ncbi:MAG TPA: D,D-dipeptide ABC transporter permease [Chloroflexi bacterium]|nr:D,D-dipeptide ABC transporter permease [Chloroflexota bacterium]
MASVSTALPQSTTRAPSRLLALRRRYAPLAFGLLILLPFVLFAIAPGLFAPYDPLKTSIRERFEPPSWEHWFGTDELGRDVYSRVVHGARISLSTGVLTIFFASVVGVVAGVIAGYWGGVPDRSIMSLVDLVLAFPSIILAMAVAAALGPSLLHSMLAVAAVWWPVYARLMRALTLHLKGEAYVEASRSIGGDSRHIILRHIIPNALSSLNVRISLDLGYAILVLASLGFIGLGASAPTPEWGAMIAWGRSYFLTEWWIGAFPGLAITLVVIGTTFLGDALNDLWNPTL